ncbi:MAG: hypothetical protein KKF24_07865 [Gammaproteobacteria bacterium]|nr:hypothetical protein [Gammaproteobacteria bacterium]
MSTGKISILVVLVIVEAMFFLLPTTGLYLLGLGTAVLGFFSANRGTVTPVYLAVAVFLLIPGYGLYSLWWLVFNFRKTSLQLLPRRIVAGATVGSLIALLFTLPFLLSGFEPPSQYVSRHENFRTMLIFGGGPLVVLISILLAMWSRDRCAE